MFPHMGKDMYWGHVVIFWDHLHVILCKSTEVCLHLKPSLRVFNQVENQAHRCTFKEALWVFCI